MPAVPQISHSSRIGPLDSPQIEREWPLEQAGQRNNPKEKTMHRLLPIKSRSEIPKENPEEKSTGDSFPAF